jgi:hypothetical protein
MEILKKKKIQMPIHSEKNYHPVINHNRIVAKKKVVLPVATTQSEILSENVKLLVERQINFDDFKSRMNKNSISLNADPIKKILKTVKDGKQVSYNNLMGTILKYENQNSTVNKCEINLEKIKPMKAHKVSNSDTTYINTHKRLLSKPTKTNSSHKDVFDWEQSIYESALNYEKNKDEITKSKSKSQIDSKEVKNDIIRSIGRRDPNSSINTQIIKWTATKNIKLVNVDLQPNIPKNKVKKDFIKLINLKTDVKIENNKIKVDTSRNTRKNLQLSKGLDFNFFSHDDLKNSSLNPNTKSTAPGTTKNLKYVSTKNKSSFDFNMPLSPYNKLKTTKSNVIMSGEKNLNNALSTRNMKLHMTSSDNFFSKTKSSS